MTTNHNDAYYPGHHNNYETTESLVRDFCYGEQQYYRSGNHDHHHSSNGHNNGHEQYNNNNSHNNSHTNNTFSTIFSGDVHAAHRAHQERIMQQYGAAVSNSSSSSDAHNSNSNSNVGHHNSSMGGSAHQHHNQQHQISPTTAVTTVSDELSTVICSQTQSPPLRRRSSFVTMSDDPVGGTTTRTRGEGTTTARGEGSSPEIGYHPAQVTLHHAVYQVQDLVRQNSRLQEQLEEYKRRYHYLVEENRKLSDCTTDSIINTSEGGSENTNSNSNTPQKQRIMELTTILDKSTQALEGSNRDCMQLEREVASRDEYIRKLVEKMAMARNTMQTSEEENEENNSAKDEGSSSTKDSENDIASPKAENSSPSSSLGGNSNAWASLQQKDQCVVTEGSSNTTKSNTTASSPASILATAKKSIRYRYAVSPLFTIEKGAKGGDSSSTHSNSTNTTSTTEISKKSIRVDHHLEEADLVADSNEMLSSILSSITSSPGPLKDLWGARRIFGSQIVDESLEIAPAVVVSGANSDRSSNDRLSNDRSSNDRSSNNDNDSSHHYIHTSSPLHTPSSPPPRRQVPPPPSYSPSRPMVSESRHRHSQNSHRRSSEGEHSHRRSSLRSSEGEHSSCGRLSRDVSTNSGTNSSKSCYTITNSSAKAVITTGFSRGSTCVLPTTEKTEKTVTPKKKSQATMTPLSQTTTSPTTKSSSSPWAVVPVASTGSPLHGPGQEDPWEGPKFKKDMDSSASRQLRHLCRKHHVDDRTTNWFLSEGSAVQINRLLSKAMELDRRSQSYACVNNPSAWLTKYFNTLRTM
jgi:hypothetical protein